MILPDSHVSFNNFVASLLVDFNTVDTIITPVYEKDWRRIGDMIANSPTFVAKGCPTTEAFSNWREWGKMMYNNSAR